MNSKENNTKENRSKIFIEKDVLGLEKTQPQTTNTKAHPGRIFIVLAVIVAIAILYWLFTGK